ncbi:MAG: hypothetical protein HY935_01485 [Nitrosomonadales bacterium]|nr:hypothetical protein [Nitrosomonadales bacterium]
MNIGKILEKLVNNAKTLQRIGFAVLALIVVIDFFLPRHHSEFFWDEIPGFSAAYGLVSFTLIVVVSKTLGHYWLGRSEDYYND